MQGAGQQSVAGACQPHLVRTLEGRVGFDPSLSALLGQSSALPRGLLGGLFSSGVWDVGGLVAPGPGRNMVEKVRPGSRSGPDPPSLLKQFLQDMGGRLDQGCETGTGRSALLRPDTVTASVALLGFHDRLLKTTDFGSLVKPMDASRTAFLTA